jgi:hypothetical protein
MEAHLLQNVERAGPLMREAGVVPVGNVSEGGRLRSLKGSKSGSVLSTSGRRMKAHRQRAADDLIRH